MRWLGAALGAALLAAGCAAPVPVRPLQPTSAEHGMILLGVTIKDRGPNPIPHRIQSAFFARLGPAGELDLDHPIPSNFTGQGYVYLLDAPPGRYGPLEVSFYRRRARYTARLEPSVTQAWAVEVRPGQISFMGNNFARSEFLGIWVTLLNIGKNIASYLPPFRRARIQIYASATSVLRSPAAEGTALRQALKDLSATAWVDPLSQRLAAIGDPPEPLTAGVIRKKKVAPLRADRFIYQDLLDWGPARSIPGGLEWRHPKGVARVGVAFIDSEAAGFRPVERFLEEVRQAGSAEDPHVLAEVRFSTRPAYSARYTVYRYPEASLVGSETRVERVETWVVPEGASYYVMQLRAEREHFDRLYPDFRRFLRYLVLTGRRESQT